MPQRFEPVTNDRPHDAPWGTLTWPPAADTVLTGPVVTLSATDAEADAEELFAALDHDRVWTHVVDRPRDPAAWTAGVQMRRSVGMFPWTVRLTAALTTANGALAAGTVVGLTAYLEVSLKDARLEIGSTTYTPSVWGTAVNPACKLLLLEHAFTAGAGRVQLKTDVRNHRSQQAIHRLGASYEGVLRRYQRRADGTVRDTVLFSITAEEWPAARAGLLARLEG